jgi:hypothetical protein
MPRGEVPGGRDNPYGRHPDRPVVSFRPRRSPEDLLERVSRGANVHGIIGAELKNDAAILREYNKDLLYVGASLVQPEVEDMAELYGLTPDDTDGIPPQQLLGDVIFVSGFSYLSNQVYPRLITASEQAQRGQFEGLAEDMMSASDATRGQFAEEVARNPFIRDLVSGEINRELETDPSGVSWLQRATQAALGNSRTELAGAKKAIAGAGRLYKFLQPPVSRGS